MSKTLYSATMVEKTVEKDNYKFGCDPSTHCMIMCDSINLESDSPQALVELCAARYCLDPDKDFSEVHDGNICFARTENDNGDEPTGRELEAFQSGAIELWNATYIFSAREIKVSQFSL